jgi:hypothetical protein
MEKFSYFRSRRFLGGETILLNASSKSFGSLDASTSRAMAMKRLWRSASVSLELVVSDLLFGAFFTGPDIFPPLFPLVALEPPGRNHSHSTFAAEWACISRLLFQCGFKRGDASLQRRNLFSICEDASNRIFGRNQPFQAEISLRRCCHGSLHHGKLSCRESRMTGLCHRHCRPLARLGLVRCPLATSCLVG